MAVSDESEGGKGGILTKETESNGKVGDRGEVR
jgi:hypothetical protein